MLSHLFHQSKQIQSFCVIVLSKMGITPSSTIFEKHAINLYFLVLIILLPFLLTLPLEVGVESPAGFTNHQHTLPNRYQVKSSRVDNRTPRRGSVRYPIHPHSTT